MLQETGIDPKECEPALEMDGPQPAKPAALSGALVQRGRDRAPHLEAPQPAAALEVAAALPTAVAAAPGPALVEAPRASRWSDVLFVAACCAAFLASFLFVLHF